jgi:hypothetical protein
MAKFRQAQRQYSALNSAGRPARLRGEITAPGILPTQRLEPGQSITFTPASDVGNKKSACYFKKLIICEMNEISFNHKILCRVLIRETCNY